MACDSYPAGMWLIPFECTQSNVLSNQCAQSDGARPLGGVRSRFYATFREQGCHAAWSNAERARKKEQHSYSYRVTHVVVKPQRPANHESAPSAACQLLAFYGSAYTLPHKRRLKSN